MITNPTEFTYLHKNNKMKVIVKLDITSVLNKIVNEMDDEQAVDELEMIFVADDEYNNTDGENNSQMFAVLNILCLNYFKSLIRFFQESKREKEKKEIYKERKDKENKKEGSTKNWFFEDGKGDDVYVVSKKAQVVLDKYRKMNDAEKWSAKQFHQYLITKYQGTYGYNSMEFGTIGGRKYTKKAQGVIWTVIKHKLIDVFVESNLSKSDLKTYIDWAYDKKSGEVNFPITLNFLTNKSLVTEWIHHLNLNGQSEKKRIKFTAKIRKFDN